MKIVLEEPGTSLDDAVDVELFPWEGAGETLVSPPVWNMVVSTKLEFIDVVSSSPPVLILLLTKEWGRPF